MALIPTSVIELAVAPENKRDLSLSAAHSTEVIIKIYPSALKFIFLDLYPITLSCYRIARKWLQCYLGDVFMELS